MREELMKRLEEKEGRMIEIRRYLHEHPEVSFKEFETAKYIADFYKDLDCEVETNVGGNGVKVTIDSGKPGKTLALRADFDALPLTEVTGLPFASKNGAMHACGHDGHTAYLLILAETLIEMKDQWHGKVVIIHQHAEEVAPGGAIGMIEAGVLDGVDNVLGCHVMSEMPVGKVFYREGEIQTGRAGFTLKIIGKGGHGSAPHTAHDAIVAGSYFVTAVQTVISRRVDPFKMGVVTIGSFDASGVPNIIKGEVEIKGDVRIMNEDTREVIEREVTKIAKGLELMFDVKSELTYLNDYPVLNNDPEFTAYVAETIKEAHIKEVDEVLVTEPVSPSEDFAYYAQYRPSCFIFIGAAPEDGGIYPHHNPNFKISEAALLIAAKSIGAVAADYLTK